MMIRLAYLLLGATIGLNLAGLLFTKSLLGVHNGTARLAGESYRAGCVFGGKDWKSCTNKANDHYKSVKGVINK